MSKTPYNMQGNWEHIAERLQERGFKSNLNAVDSTLRRISKMSICHNIPQGAWFKPIMSKNREIGFVCGEGHYLSTILHVQMTPVGVEI